MAWTNRYSDPGRRQPSRLELFRLWNRSAAISPDAKPKRRDRALQPSWESWRPEV
jgi:hypothetical protein